MTGTTVVRVPVRLRLLAASLRWRAGSAVLLVAVSAVAVAAGAFGPLYLAGAQRSVLATTLAAAAPGVDGLTLLGPDGRADPAPLDRAERLLAGGGAAAYYGPPLTTYDATLATTVRGQPYKADLEARSGVCGQLSFAAGGCPAAPDSVALSTRTAAELGLRVGSRWAVAAGGRPAVVTVAGLYRPGDPAAPYWWGEDPFGFGLGSAATPTLDDVFAPAATVRALTPPGRLAEVVQAPLQPAAVVAGGTAPFDAALAGLRRAAGAAGVSATTEVGQPLGSAAAAGHATATIVTVIDLQLVLLSLLVLYFVAARAAEGRQADLRLAQLRGYPRRAMVSLTLAEPLLLLAASVPAGLAAAWLAARAAGRHLFVPGPAPGIGALSVAAALGTFVAGALATVVASRRLLAGGPEEGVARAPARHRTAGVVADTVAVAASAAAFAEVALVGVGGAGRTDPLAALAPGLLALGAGVLGARLLPLAARAGIGPTRDTRWAGTAVATRRLARRRELSRHVVVLSLALGLGCFAVTGWLVAGHNRTVRSQVAVGADRVVTVAVRPGVDLLAAVRGADPSGRQAMAAVLEQAPDGTLLAVDSTRLADVAYWPAALGAGTAAGISRALRPPTAPAVTLAGPALAVTATAALHTRYPPHLQAVVFDDAYQTLTTLDLGPLRAGTATYGAPTAGHCDRSCRLVSVGLAWAPPGDDPGRTTTVSLTLHGLSALDRGGRWQPVPAGLDRRGGWVPASAGAVAVPAGRGLAVRATLDADDSLTSVGPADVPAVLPAVTSGGVPVSGGVEGVGLDGSTIPLRPVADVAAVPGAGPGAALVDLTLARRLQTGPQQDATDQVWLSPAAGPAVLARLAAAGVVPLRTASVAADQRVGDRSGVSLAYDLFALAAVAAALLALAATAFSVVAAAGRRRRELAGLRAAGVGARPLARSVALEQGAVIGTGLVLGVAAGLVAAAVSLPSVPELVDAGPGPALTYALPAAALALAVGALAAGLAVTVVVAARVTVGRSVPGAAGSR